MRRRYDDQKTFQGMQLSPEATAKLMQLRPTYEKHFASTNTVSSSDTGAKKPKFKQDANALYKPTSTKHGGVSTTMLMMAQVRWRCITMHL